MSESTGPKLHKAKDAWKTIHATRPVDPHPHVSLAVFRFDLLLYNRERNPSTVDDRIS